MKKETCVIGLFHKEAFFTPYWQKYYGRLFGYENLYVIGDLINDRFLNLFHKDVHKIELNAEYQSDFHLHVATIQHTQASLLNFYDTVIFAEADEFIIPDLTKYIDLKDFLAKNNDRYFRVNGFNIIADLDSEGLIDPSYPLISQRKWWYNHIGECKTLVVRDPVEWYGVGFHECRPLMDICLDLYNIHFHEFDYEIQNTRIQMRFDTQLPLHQYFKPGGLGGEGFLFHEHLEEYHRSKFNTHKLELIPEIFKESRFI